MSAGLLLAFTATSFAAEKSEVKAEKGCEESSITTFYPCVYNILIKNRNGDVVKTISYNGTTPDPQRCCDWSDNNVAIWTKQLANSPGYTATSDLQV